MRITEQEYLTALEVVKSYKEQIDNEIKLIENEVKIDYLNCESGDFVVFKKVNSCRKDVIIGHKYIINQVCKYDHIPFYAKITIKINGKIRYFRFGKDSFGFKSDTNIADFYKN